MTFVSLIHNKHTSLSNLINRWLKAEVNSVETSSWRDIFNGHLKYPNNLDQSLNDAAADKIRKYCADYNNRPTSVVSFMPAIVSTSGRLHSEFVRFLFLQTHRETDLFFFQFQEFSQPNQTWDLHTSTFAARLSWISWSQNVDCYSQRLLFYVLPSI